MEKSEHTLVPEWLKNAGSSNGGVSASHSDNRGASRIAKNKSFVNVNGHDFGQASGSDMATSPYFRRSSSSNGYGNLTSYSSFGRNQRDKEWEKDTYDSRDRSKLVLGNRRQRDQSNLLGHVFSSKYESDRYSQSMVSGKRGDTWHKKVATDFNANRNNNISLCSNGNPVSEVKSTFERDFPSLSTEERAYVPEIRRIPSPGLASAIGGEKWTSALAEVPILVGSNGTPSSSVQLGAPSSSMPVALGTTSSLNMAKTVAQGPSRAQTVPQLSVETQRREELAIKQSRQLIPMTPSMPKNLVVNTSDKHKSKVGQLHHPISSPLPITHFPRVGPIKADVSKSSNVGKLHILNPVREKNSITPVVKDTPILTPVANSTQSVVSTRGSPNKQVLDCNKPPVLTVLEKRPTSHAKSRKDFFNLVRQNSMANSLSFSSSAADSATPNSSPESIKLTEREVGVTSDVPLAASLSGDHLSEDRNGMTCNGDADNNNNGCNGKKYHSFPEEEEAAFLRLLGWNEHSEEGGLTEEEINAFYRDLTKYNHPS